MQAACGLPYNKLKEQIVDIDAVDRDNNLAVVEYVEEMYTFYKSVEVYRASHYNQNFASNCVNLICVCFHSCVVWG